ncbi:hypothetical protein GCM10022284_50830 [Streptomyces hundungensis]
MGKQTNRGGVQHAGALPGGGIGCRQIGCFEAATRWIDMERYGDRRWLSTAYCDAHGDWELNDPYHTMRVRQIKH